jgi:hypothetical protein
MPSRDKQLVRMARVVTSELVHGAIRDTDAQLLPFGIRGPRGVNLRSFTLCGLCTIFQPSGWQVKQYLRGWPLLRSTWNSAPHIVHVLAMRSTAFGMTGLYSEAMRSTASGMDCMPVLQIA